MGNGQNVPAPTVGFFIPRELQFSREELQAAREWEATLAIYQTLPHMLIKNQSSEDIHRQNS
jgi:hypothetical protein